jgi:glycosyltransferase involved in cell wall biosynthesis
MTTSKKTLLHFSPLADIGGCEVNCLRVIEGLGDYLHQVLVFDERGPMSAKWESAGAQVDHLAAWRTGRRKFRSALAAWVKTQPQPDGIYYWSTSRLPAVIGALRLWPVPLAVYLGNPVATGLIPNVRRWVHEQLHPTPRTVTLVACSNHVAASHRHASYFRRFPTKMIYNAVAPALDQAHEYRKLPAGSSPRVGMVARLDCIKDHSTVIRALAALIPIRSDIIIEFAGDGDLRRDLEHEARRLGVADRVRFLGFVEVGPLLAEWDIYVHSTTAAEGMGTAVAEAMMAGLPCIVSDLDVMREVCGDDGAHYVPAADAAALGQVLLLLIEDRARREALGLAAQTRARRIFARPQVAEAYLQVVSPDPAKELV